MSLLLLFKTGIRNQSISGTVTPAGALKKDTNRTLTGSVTPVGTLVKKTLRSFAASVATSGTLVKTTFRLLTGTITPTGALSALRVVFKSLSGTVTPAGTLVRQTNKMLAGTVTPAGAVRKLISRLLSGVVTAIGNLSNLTINEATTITTIGGVPWSLQYDTLEIEDNLNDLPNLCTFQTRQRPAEGQTILITRGYSNTIEFFGNILTVNQVYQELPVNLLFTVTAQDTSWKFNRRLVTQRWVNKSATEIATNIVDNFTTGFTKVNIVAGLPTIPEFECILELPLSALSRLAKEFGGNCYPDYGSDIHLFITESTDAPDDLLLTTPFSDLTYQTDLTSVLTRIKAVGGGSAAAIDLASGMTSAPLENATPFEVGGGSFISGANIGAYTSKHDGGVGSKISGNVVSPGGSAPTAAIKSNVVGVIVGAKNYKVAFGNDQGETVPGSVSNTVTGVAFTPPTAPSLAASGVIGYLIGAYIYVLTYVTNLGETTAGTTASRTAVATAAPTTPSVAVNASMGKLIGAYGYKITFESLFGESAGSTAGTRTAVITSGPSTPTCTATTIGPLLGSYHYKIAFVGPDGKESLATSAQSFSHSGSTATTPSISGTSGGGFHGRGRVAWRHPIFGESIWSAFVTYDAVTPITVTATGLPAGCTWVVFYTGAFTGGAEASAPYIRGSADFSNTGAQNIDTISGTVVSAAGNTMGGNCSLSSIATGPTGTIARRIYRTKVGAGSGGPYYLVGEIGDNSTTTYNDVTPDVALTVAAPSQNLNGESFSITSVQTGPSGTIRRNIYRTEAGGSTYYFLRAIEDNSTTSFVDNATDAELNKGRQPPASSTSGEKIALTSIPLGPTGTLARNIYRTEAGASSYKFVGQLTDNTTTVFTDNKKDSELGDYVPLINTAGANQIELTSIPLGGTGVTQRVLYRLALDGTYKYLDTINDNSTTTYTDNKDEGELGRTALAVGTIGASVGDTTLALSSVAGLPTAGWLLAENLLIRYTGISGSSLTGIPGPRTITSIVRSGTTATVTTSGSHGFVTDEVVTIQGADQNEYNGSRKITVTGSTTFTYTVAGSPTTPATGTKVVLAAGAILSAIRGDTPVVSAPFLSGVTGISYAISRGNSVLLYTVRNDAAAQAALALLEGGDGIHEGNIEDASITTLAGLNGAADAQLNNYKSKIPSITFESRDVKLRSGKTVPVNLPDARAVVGSFLIQRVVSNKFNFNRKTLPLRTVDAAPIRVTWQDFVKRENLKKENPR